MYSEAQGFQEVLNEQIIRKRMTEALYKSEGYLNFTPIKIK